MEIKKIILIIFIFFNIKTYSESLESCREHKDIKVRNDYIEHIFNSEGTKKIGEKIVRGYLSRDWSNLTANLKDIYYSYSKPEFHADSVEITYTLHGTTKPLYKISKKLIRLEEKLFKIDKYTFNDGVREKRFRPALQVFTFKRDQKPICSIKVNHYYAEEY